MTQYGSNLHVIAQEDPGPRRASLRQRGVAADGSRVDEELRGGKVTIINGEVLREPAGNSRHREPSPPKERHAKGEQHLSRSVVIACCTCHPLNYTL